MPGYQNNRGPTVAEREAELIALQSAFDEYIASSRELEEELDAELAKMQEKLAESQSANAALSSQLENISPQLTSLETALTSARQKLKEEQKLRRAAEQAQDEADQRLREMEQSLQTLREECDDVHEELAFKENELEETRLELEVEKQQLENELEKLRGALSNEQRNTARQSSLMDHTESAKVPREASNHATDAASENDDDYAKKLEEELELVTEQLIETEKRLLDTEEKLSNKENIIRTLETEGRREEDQDIITKLQTDNADLLEQERKVRDELSLVMEELALSKEEITLQQEELQAAEEDLKHTREIMEEERMKHRQQVTDLTIQLKEAEIGAKNTIGEAALVASTVQAASNENQQLQMQISALENALDNAKKDYQSVCEELDAINSRFDEAREIAKREGKEAAAEELKASMKLDTDHEIMKMKEDIAKLAKENNELQKKVDDAEMKLASFKDTQESKKVGKEGGSEVVKQLQTQLDRAKKQAEQKDKEMSALKKNLEERIEKAEKDASRLETELGGTKSKLAEAEAHLIVLRREKEKAEAYAPGSPIRKHKIADIDVDGAPGAPDLGDRGRSREAHDSPSRARSSSPASIMKLEYKLAEEEKKYKELEKQFNELQDQKRIGEVRIKRLEEDLKVLQKQVLAQQGGDAAVVTQMSRLSSLASGAKTDNSIDVINDDEIGGRRVDSIIQSRDHKKMAEELKSLEKKCNSQREYNAQLLSKMLHLQGNIQVYCRIRPMSIKEIEQGCKSVVEPLSETEVGCFDERTNKWKSFAFDRVWGPDQSQKSVFQDVEPLALSVVDGFNACIFAYGQTGSGKTFTMEGIPEGGQHGISYRTIQKIFHLLKLRAQQQRTAEILVGVDQGSPEIVGFEYTLKVGMLEIYNDEIYDLLATSGASMAEKKAEAMRAGGKASLDIRRNDEGRVEVPNLTKEDVTNIEEVMALLERGNSNRATACTDMNEHSSRSHMVLIVDVTSGMGESDRNSGTLFLVDLAGSERVRKSNVEGDQLKEAGFINKSLSALGNVMEALDRKASHIPYRDSKLTYLLQDSIGGNSRTMMVVATCPMDHSYDETVHALQFATRVRRIQIGAAQRNVTSKNLEETVKQLTDEMKTLTKAKERTELQLNTLKRDNTRVQEKLQNLSKARSQNKSDTKTLEMLKKNNDDMAARWQKEKKAREEVSEELDASRKECRTLQQQIGKFKSKIQILEQKMEDKEKSLEQAQQQLRQQRNQQTASTFRARRDQVIRKPTAKQNIVVSSPPATTRKQVKATAHTPAAPALSEESATPAPAKSIGGDSSSREPSESNDGDTFDIREQVLSLLKKYDQAKVDRIDIIMEKFKGKEALLLEKMTQRYEGASGSVASSSIQQRNAMALQRHQERMKKINEKNKKAGA